jgi:hypothetical protein
LAIRSFDPNWAKLWFCPVAITESPDWPEMIPEFDPINRCLKTADNNGFRAIRCQSGKGLLSVKGGFLTETDCFQYKCPLSRAVGLHQRGDA